MTATLDMSTRIYAEDGVTVRLSRPAVWIIEVLSGFYPHAGTSQEIGRAIWGTRNCSNVRRNLRVQAHLLRETLSAAGVPPLIEGKVGYRLTRPVVLSVAPVVIPQEAWKAIEMLLRSHPAAISANRVLARIGAPS